LQTNSSLINKDENSKEWFTGDAPQGTTLYLFLKIIQGENIIGWFLMGRLQKTLLCFMHNVNENPVSGKEIYLGTGFDFVITKDKD